MKTILLSSHEEATSQWLSKEIEKTQQSLDCTEDKIAKLDASPNDRGDASPKDRLLELNKTILSLELTQELSKWSEQRMQDATLIEEAKECFDLGFILLNNPVHQLLHHVWTKEYQPLFAYIRAQLLLFVRQSLRQLNYPSNEACDQLIQNECENFHETKQTITSSCVWLARLQKQNVELVSHLTGKPQQTQRSEIVLELSRPIVERVSFHFLQQSEDRISSTKIDRLPEWLFNYLRENALNGGPWSYLCQLSSLTEDEAIMLEFLEQIAKLADFVLTQRKFFRHERIAGQKSLPLLLSSAIEQILSFDSYLRDLAPSGDTLTSLSQRQIAADDELWAWWVSQERLYTMTTLFETATESGLDRVVPRAELFCALIHSIQSKASLVPSKAGDYVAQVAVPLCQDFLDAIHESSRDLKSLLGQRKLVAVEDLQKNLEEWIDLINGANMASVQLVQGKGSGAPVDNDLARVGRSIERLRDALIDECSSVMIETVMMERAKLASYLMRCSHALSFGEATEPSGLSADLEDTASILNTINKVCTDNGQEDSVTSFAPLALRSNITDRLADKFLEVALDAHGMTPELTLEGALGFQKDMVALFRPPLLPPLAMRLIDVSRFMSLGERQFGDLRGALSGLVMDTPDGQLPLELQFGDFSQDGTILDEAVSMVRAKGFVWLHLEDALSILNRRHKP